MKQEDFALIEQGLEITLPESYKKAAVEAKISKTKHPSQFYDEPHKVISTNKRLREKGLYGQLLRKNHYVIGYERDGSDYYFIDLNLENGPVYLANKTKTWKYTPEDIINNESPYNSIDEFVDFMCDLNAMVENSTKNPRPEQTDEEKQKMIADFFADMNKQFPRNKK